MSHLGGMTNNKSKEVLLIQMFVNGREHKTRQFKSSFKNREGWRQSHIQLFPKTAGFGGQNASGLLDQVTKSAKRQNSPGVFLSVIVLFLRGLIERYLLMKIKQ